MGKKIEIIVPERSQRDIQPLKGDRPKSKDGLDFLSIFALLLAAFGIYRFEPAYALGSLFLLISIYINQSTRTSIFSNSIISIIFCSIAIWKLYDTLSYGINPRKANE